MLMGSRGGRLPARRTAESSLRFLRRSTPEEALAGDYILRREVEVPLPQPAVFDFFSRAENLEELTPPWLHFRIVTSQPIEMTRGAVIAYQLRVRGIPIRWLTEIELWRPPYEFVDVQVKGPYKVWRHMHRFEEIEDGTRIVDVVNYSLPFGVLGRLVHRLQVADDLRQIFDFREQRVRTLLR
jgi:ligand-binding SRPBCC domain-containing protein